MFTTFTTFSGSRSRRVAFFLLLSCYFFLSASTCLSAQSLPSGAALEKVILQHDSIFWAAYNACDVGKMMSFVADDVEFYHDKGGQTNGRNGLAKTLQGGLCSSGDNTVERRPVAGTIGVFPVAGVGAILRGQHTFHSVQEPGSGDIALFFHFWKFMAGEWKMTRIFSYDHVPLPANEGIKSIELTATQLEKFAGTYEAPQTGTVRIQANEQGLSLFNGNETLPLFAKSSTVFFNKQLPLEFKFTLDKKGEVTKFSVFEKGVKVEEATRVR